MKTKFTKGPWTVERSQNGELEPFDQHDNHLLNSYSDLPLEEREANATLIEAAPKLFEALRRIANSEPRPLKGNLYCWDDIDHFQRIAHAAIAKVLK